ncbi:iron uptake transporter permease EfeU [Nakamurella alba]|uniref:iron uptake transporter permease EfeU n=1 Tax=Nakamurella alba TaxID=2665158 RepID=UPI002AC317F5|nr:iron uptake transporter permease EfeU [Nakamurella alba]
MLATFVIGLREGLEAALIVGIIAAFLRQNGRSDALRRMWLGVGAAVVICILVGVGLEVVNENLPQRQQEMLECVVAGIAVVMVSYMILWMRKHSRDLRKDLQVATGEALAAGSATALVVMAFLAVFREGFETSVFLLAAFQSAVSPALAELGAVLGIAVALVLGYLVYRGGVRLNLAKFFRITGVVLVFVAAGLVMSTLRAAYEAGWLTVGQQTAVSLTSVVRPGSVVEGLLTGVLGIRSTLPVIEVVAWLLYLVSMLAVVLWPARRVPAAGTRAVMLAGIAGVAALVAVVLVVTVRPPALESATATVTAQGQASAGTDPTDGTDLAGTTVAVTSDLILTTDRTGAAITFSGDVTLSGTTTLTLSGHRTDNGVSAARYQGTPVSGPAAGLPAELTRDQVIAIGGGRLPVGAGNAGRNSTFGAAWTDTVTPVVDIDPSTGQVLAVDLTVVRSLELTASTGRTLIGGDVLTADLTTPAETIAGLAERSDERSAAADRAQVWGSVIPSLLAVFAVVVAGFAIAAGVARRRAGPTAPTGAPVEPPSPVLSGDQGR